MKPKTVCVMTSSKGGFTLKSPYKWWLQHMPAILHDDMAELLQFLLYPVEVPRCLTNCQISARIDPVGGSHVMVVSIYVSTLLKLQYPFGWILSLRYPKGSKYVTLHSYCLVNKGAADQLIYEVPKSRCFDKLYHYTLFDTQRDVRPQNECPSHATLNC